MGAPHRRDLDGAELRRRYEAGEGVLALANAYDAAVATIVDRLHKAGATMRPRGRRPKAVAA